MLEKPVGRHDYPAAVLQQQMQQGNAFDSPAGMVRRDDELPGWGEMFGSDYLYTEIENPDEIVEKGLGCRGVDLPYYPVERALTDCGDG